MKYRLNPRTINIRRRSFLRSSAFGIGTAVHLPLLEAMFKTESAFAQAPFDGTRFFAMYTPNGMIEEKWFPAGSAKTGWTTEGTSLAGFANRGVQNEISFYQKMNNASSFGSQGNDHLVSISSWLTGKTIPNDDLAKFRWSLDQEHADWMLQKELGTKDGLPNPDSRCWRMAGNSELDAGRMMYNNKQKNALNWSKSGQILDLVSDLRGQFDKIYSMAGDGPNGGGGGGGINRRTRLKISALDDVKQDLERLVKRVGQEDGARLERYFQTMREIEQSLDTMATMPAAPVDCNKPMANDAVPSIRNGSRAAAIGTHMKTAAKLTAHAFNCGLIHSATYCAGGEAAGCQYSDIGVNLHFHNNVSHNRGGQYNNWVKIDTFHSDHCAMFMEEMKNTPFGGGDLLDNTAVMYGTGLGNGDRHQRTDIALMVGGRFGKWKHGNRHVIKGKSHAALVDTIRRELGMQTIGEGEVPIS